MARPAIHAVPAVDEAFLAKYDVAGPRYTSYPTAPVWTEAFGPSDYAEALKRASRDPSAPLSIYVHIPFCWHMCSYCGCNVIVTKNQNRADAYLDLLEREVALVAAHLGDRRKVNQLHLGGGTPTFLDEAQMRRLVDIVTRDFPLMPGGEASIEVNPTVTEQAQLGYLRTLGFNRISLGVQDFDPAVQDAIERTQTFEETRSFVEAARAAGFQSVNFDLIYGLPRQTETSWGKTLEQVIALAPDRLAVYSFAYLPRLKPHQRKLPSDQLPKGLAKLELLRQAFGAFTGAGYEAIGMDHFAAPHDGLAQAVREGTLWRNFQGYTVRSAGDTVAFGVTGIGDIGGAFVQNQHLLSGWQAAVEAGHLPVQKGMVLSADDHARRGLITQFMCNLTVDLGQEGVSRYEPALRPMIEDGLCHLQGTQLTASPLGRLFLRNIAMVFDAYLGGEGGEARFSRTV